MSLELTAEIIHYLLPQIVIAGRYSAQIQGGVHSHAAKPGETVFHTALSDADLTVQSFLEVVLLAKYPTVSFFSEEQAQSLNVKYFPKDAELEILLDPIDGTRPYLDKRENYQIIVTIHDRTDIIGAISHMPRKDLTYTAIRGMGAFAKSGQDIHAGRAGRKLSIDYKGGPVLLFNLPEIKRKLAPTMEVVDLVEAYASTPGKYDVTDLIEGRAAAKINSPVQAIDDGALSFIAAEAGALRSSIDGKPLESFRSSPYRVLPGQIISANKEIHTQIVETLKLER